MATKNFVGLLYGEVFSLLGETTLYTVREGKANYCKCDDWIERPLAEACVLVWDKSQQSVRRIHTNAGTPVTLH